MRVALIGPWSWMTAWVPTITIGEPVVPGSVTPALSGRPAAAVVPCVALRSGCPTMITLGTPAVPGSVTPTLFRGPGAAVVPRAAGISDAGLLSSSLSAPATRLPPQELAVPPVRIVETGDLLRMSGPESNILVMAHRASMPRALSDFAAAGRRWMPVRALLSASLPSADGRLIAVWACAVRGRRGWWPALCTAPEAVCRDAARLD